MKRYFTYVLLGLNLTGSIVLSDVPLIQGLCIFAVVGCVYELVDGRS